MPSASGRVSSGTRRFGPCGRRPFDAQGGGRPRRPGQPPGRQPPALTAWVRLSCPPSEDVASSLTVYVPGLSYVWCGFRAVEVDPSPNVHSHVTAFFVRLVKLAVRPSTLNENATRG